MTSELSLEECNFKKRGSYLKEEEEGADLAGGKQGREGTPGERWGSRQRRGIRR